MWFNIVEDKSKIYLTQHKQKITLDKANIINIKKITFEGVNKILKENKIDILINCVGLTNVEKCEINIEQSYYLNSKNTTNSFKVM